MAELIAVTSESAFPNARILIFGRAPEVGQVKTRLAPAIGAYRALALYKRLVAGTIGMVTGSSLAPAQLWIAGDTGHSFFGRHATAMPSDARFPQRGRDLGERMAHALATALAQPGVDRAVLSGTDIPALDEHYLRAALAALDDHDAVLGPAEDGGYVLIGLTRPEPRLFEDIAWSTPRVLDATRIRLTALGWRHKELPVLWDVDTPEDLLRLRTFEARRQP